MLLGLTAYAQQSQYVIQETKNVSSFHPKNEIRLNLLESVAGLPEINYERFVEDNFGVGLAMAASLENVEDSRIRALILPYGRLYFGDDNPATGFYIEGNMGLVLQKSLNYNYSETSYITESKYYSGLGIGVAGGYKFLSKNNWVGEFSLGVGRVFVNRVEDAYPRVGITLGKRF